MRACGRDQSGHKNEGWPGDAGSAPGEGERQGHGGANSR